MKRLHLNVYCFKVLKYLTIRNKSDFDKTKLSEAAVENYKAILNSFSPDVHSSSLAANCIDVSYDLHIIVPVYKVERYIQECVESILNQRTKYSFWVTIINDGSPDSSRQLLEKYESIKNVEIIDQPNKGISAARNSGLKCIKGKYVTFVDSDDKLHPGAIEAFMNAAYKYSADIVQGSYVRITTKSKIFQYIKLPVSVLKNDDSNLLGLACTKVYKSALFKNVQFPEKYWFEDTVNGYVLFQKSIVNVSIDDFVYEYRKNEKSISYSSCGKPKTLDTLYITEALLKDASNYSYFDSDKFYTRQFKQFKSNCIRLNSLNNVIIENAAFMIQCYLIEKYFSKNYAIKSKDFSINKMEIAIKTRNFKLYKLIAEWI